MKNVSPRSRSKSRSFTKQRKAQLASVVTIAYNQERFIAETVQGLLSQTYRPTEILILDDCSQDATADIIEGELARRPGRTDVRFIRNSHNLGARANLLKGLSLAMGQFIVIHAGDDIMLPKLVEK